jgi:hypothetical protein
MLLYICGEYGMCMCICVLYIVEYITPDASLYKRHVLEGFYRDVMTYIPVTVSLLCIAFLFLLKGTQVIRQHHRYRSISQ